MAASKVDINTEQGADFGPWTFTWHEDGEVVDGVVTPGDPIPLTGGAWRGRLQIRSRRDNDLAKAELWVTATSEDGDIILDEDPDNGQITILIPGDKMDGVIKAAAQYDMKLYDPDGREFFVVYGKVTNRVRVTVDEDA